MSISCAGQNTQQKGYDDSKYYAAFLVFKNADLTASLENAKNISLAEGYEIGPIEYYSSGITDFEPILKRLVPGKQVNLLWVVGNIMDIPNIQKGISKISFKGEVRYAKPVAGPSSILQDD